MAKPPYSSGTDSPKPPSCGQALDDLFGDVAVGRGARARRAGRTLSSAKRWKVSRTSSKSSPRCRGPFDRRPARPARPGPAAVAEEGGGRRDPAGARRPSAPRARPPGRPGRRRRRRRRRGDAGLDLPVGAVVEGGPGRGHGGRRVGHVVGDHLVGVDAAVPAGPTAHGLVDEVTGPGRPPRRRRRGRRWGGRRHRERPYSARQGAPPFRVDARAVLGPRARSP